MPALKSAYWQGLMRCRLIFLPWLESMRKLLDKIPLMLLVLVCLTLGLAPFMPEPHLLEKLKMLGSGELSRPVDVFDLLLHGAPWLLLVLKLTLCRNGKAEH
jgi:hypothetical protein